MRRPALYATALVTAGLIGCGLYRRLKWSGYYIGSRAVNTRREMERRLRSDAPRFRVTLEPRIRFRPERAGVA